MRRLRAGVLAAAALRAVAALPAQPQHAEVNSAQGRSAHACSRIALGAVPLAFEASSPCNAWRVWVHEVGGGGAPVAVRVVRLLASTRQRAVSRWSGAIARDVARSTRRSLAAAQRSALPTATGVGWGHVRMV